MMLSALAVMWSARETERRKEGDEMNQYLREIPHAANRSRYMCSVYGIAHRY